MGVSNDTYAWLVRNRIVTLEMMKDDLVDYFSNSDEVLGDVLWPEGGFFDGVTLAADGNDKFKIGGLSGVDGTVGGDLLNLTARQADVEKVQFENTVAVDYHVGLRDARLPDTSTSNITVNPKDGLPNWTFFRHIVGVSGTPDAVVDNGNGTITLTVNSITESGVSNAGRIVKVFQMVPAKGALTDVVAMESPTVVWNSPNNKITTVGDLGQTTISITPGDYVVVLVGPRVLRNTDISTDTTYAYVGTVTGIGAGSPPSAFDVSGQRLLSASSSLLWQVTRVENVPPNRLKIDVKAIAGESGVNQIQVQSSASAVVFSVDEAGNAVVEGDFEVKGTMTTRDVDQINTHDAYFDNLDAGNADTDTHNIKGEWTHTSAGGGIAAFVVDGDTGRVGIGGSYDGVAALKVTGNSRFVGNLLPSADDSYDLGESGTPLEWRDLYLDGTAYIDTLDAGGGKIIGDVAQLKLSDIPLRIDTTGAGADEKKWALEVVSNGNEILTLTTKTDTPPWGAGAAFFEAKRTIDSTAVELLTLTATEIAIAGNLVPDAATRSLGGTVADKKWKLLFLSVAAGEGVATSLVPATSALDLGNASYPWQKLFLATGAGLGVATSLVPATTALGLGNASYPWQKLFLSVAADEGVATSLIPATTALDLGNASYPWRRLFLSDTANEGVATHLVPSTALLDLGNASYPWRRLFLSVAAGLGVATSLIPATTALDLGNASYPWRKFFLSDAADEGVATNLVPSTTLLELGNASYPWKKLYLSSATGYGVATNLIPATSGTLYLGNSDFLWKNFYLSSAAGDGVGTDLVPATTALDLGNASYPWQDTFASGTVKGGQHTATDLTGSGGGADTVTYTAGRAGTTSPGATVLAGGNQNAGFVKIFVDDAVAYLAFWTAIT